MSECFRTGKLFHFPVKELDALTEEMMACIATIDAVVAIGIYQLAKVFISLYQCLGIFCRIAEVDIVIGHSMTQQQGAM